MKRFLVITLTILGLYTCGAGAIHFVSSAHFGWDILNPMERLKETMKGKTPEELVAEMDRVHKAVLENATQRHHASSDFAIKIMLLGGVQMALALLMAGFMKASPTSAGRASLA